MAVLVVFCGTSQGAGYSVRVAWDANPEPNISGYKLHYGPTGAGVTNVLDVGHQTSGTATNLLFTTEYFFFVTAYDAFALESGPSPVLTYVTPANHPPTVELGADRIAVIPDFITIDATASDDHLTAEQLSAAWSQVAGPSTVGIAGGTKFSPMFQFLVPGAYVFRVAVSDGNLTASDEVTVHAHERLTSPPPGEVVPNITSVFETLDGLILQWDSAPGALYRIGHKRELGETSWAVIADRIASQGPTTYWVDGSDRRDQQGFYAVFKLP